MGNFCTCCDQCRDGERQDFEPNNFISVPKANNSNVVEVDFHNFKKDTAEKLLRRVLDKYKNPNYAKEVKEINLIVGAGNHTEGGAEKRVIYPMVYDVVKTDYPGFSCKDHPKNHGIVICTRPQK